MVTFSTGTTKELQTVGDVLRASRLTHGLSLDEISQATLIRRQHLESLEQNMCDTSLEPVYREQFLKNYTTYLGLEWNTVKDHYEREQDVYCRSRHAQPHLPLQKVERKHLWVTARIVHNSILGTVLGSVVAYLAFLGITTFHPPELVVYSPPNNLSSTATTIIVSGRANYDSGIKINGKAIYKDKDGAFHQEIDLKDGVNVIQVSAMKKFGQEQTVSRTVIVNHGGQAAALHNLGI